MRTLIWGLAWSLSVLVAPAAMAQDRGLAIEYTVKVADIPGQLFHVTTDIRNVNQPSLELSLRNGTRAELIGASLNVMLIAGRFCHRL